MNNFLDLFSVDIKLKFQTQFSGLKLERKPETRMPEKCMDRISVYFKLITSLDLHGRARIFVWRNRTYITAQQWPLYLTDFWSGTKVIFWGDMSCMHISSCIYLYAISPAQKSKSTLKIMQKSTLKSRNPLWNPEIHFEIQKSTWNTEIQSEIRNPREIQWISKSRTPRRAVADPSPRIHADRLLKQIVSFGSLQPFTVRILGDFPSFLSALAVSCLLA